MTMKREEPGDQAHRDQTSTEPPADRPPESPSEQRDSEESGGPYGNPAVDEDSLRKQQEQSSERND
jgi:hypothetical protein